MIFQNQRLPKQCGVLSSGALHLLVNPHLSPSFPPISIRTLTRSHINKYFKDLIAAPRKQVNLPSIV